MLCVANVFRIVLLEVRYQGIKSKKGAPKVIIVSARKFLDIICKTLKNKWIFEDFPNFKLASPYLIKKY
jgi:hypothetical protein